MTTDTSATAGDDLELFDDAKEEFAAKEDLKDRLVAIFVTGRTGTRKSEADGKPYTWVETVTLVLDNGPNGDLVTDLAPETSPENPVILDGLQWSTKGMVSRLEPRVNAKNARPLRGRINSRKNAKRGFADSWSISEPTDEDKALSRQYNATVAKIMKDIEGRLAGGNAADDDSAFD